MDAFLHQAGHTRITPQTPEMHILSESLVYMSGRVLRHRQTAASTLLRFKDDKKMKKNKMKNRKRAMFGGMM
ncbi:hypothetical protein EYF80_064580 [Liparis tanakae]|uniref:Uncharacterized protein n=1 Tax=Liparis tanakae TaxID=230148 RepID=A0A4Z2EAK7_9TELE|nr:hypothetical protein EYF80_064580 [Liparis tanakae]